MAEVIPREVAALYTTAQSLLDADDARNNLVLGVLKSAAEPAPIPPFGWEVCDAGKLVGIGICTPPLSLLLSDMPANAADAVADALHERALLPITINGPKRVTDRVCERLVLEWGARAERLDNLRLFELRRVIPVRGVAGKLRLAEATDASFVAACYEGFEREAMPHERGLRDGHKLVARLLAQRHAYLWEDAGVAVCFAVKKREIGGGAAIGLVYTPQAHRGRGYASALVAALSQALLDEGKVYTCLFTDRNNPVSNSIYPKLGYVPLEDFQAWKLLAPLA